jgi:hypothetical protein
MKSHGTVSLIDSMLLYWGGLTPDNTIFFAYTNNPGVWIDYGLTMADAKRQPAIVKFGDRHFIVGDGVTLISDHGNPYNYSLGNTTATYGMQSALVTNNAMAGLYTYGCNYEGASGDRTNIYRYPIIWGSPSDIKTGFNKAVQ